VKLFFHYCPYGFSNCFILGTDTQCAETPPVAIIIDPGEMDTEVLNIIERNDYALKAVLITHDHPHHVQGIKAIMKIYDTEIFAINPVICDHRTTLVKDGDVINIGQFNIEVISVPGHTADSAAFKIERLLFTGDALTSGLVGKTMSSYAATTQVNALRNKILSLPGEYIILPGHGPPSSLEAERRFNMGMNTFAKEKKRRPAFRVEF
jgi:glyoxylase-like metal-dependent hydrolase (beta-lactamase superfamily II)